MIAWLAEICGKNLLAEKWLLAEELRIALQWKDRVNSSGCGTVNLHSKTLATITTSLSSNELARRNLTYMSNASMRMTLRHVISQLREEGKLGYFGDVRAIDGLAALLAKSIRDLRLACVAPDSIDPEAFESRRKASDVRLIYQTYCESIERHAVVDDAACIAMVIEGIEDGAIELPPDLLILMPESPPRSHLETRLLTVLAAKKTLLHPVHLDPNSVAPIELPDRVASAEGRFGYFAGFGEVNEIRGVFQSILASVDRGARLDDVEIVYSDYQQYVPLILDQMADWVAELNDDRTAADLERLPVTFGEGIACLYSRPGRALRGWLRWARHDFVQSRMVQLIREGLLVRPENAKTIGYTRLAGSLRRVPIGFQIDRYIPKIAEAITSSEQSLQEFLSHGDKDVAGDDDKAVRDFGLAALRALYGMVERMVTLAPLDSDDAVTILEKSKGFLARCARAESKLDRVARAKLLDDVDAMVATIKLDPETEFDVFAWLEELPAQSHVLASGPRPGCVHTTRLAAGGHSGRRHTFVVGLDDGRYPRRVSVDPVLLDAERNRLSPELRTAQDVSEQAQQALDRLVHRALNVPDGRITFSYSLRDLVEDRNRFPSPSMLGFYRMTERRDDADLGDLLAHIGQPVSFIRHESEGGVSLVEDRLSLLVQETDTERRRQSLEQQFVHTRRQRLASEAENDSAVGEFDGLVPIAGVDLDPTKAAQISPSRLETYGACPRRFLFRYGLGVHPPDEWLIDRERWLDPLQIGNLVHELFEQFLRDLTVREMVPCLKRDRSLLFALLQEKLAHLTLRIPIPNQDAFRRTRDMLEETCEIFLREEEEYCREFEARPWVLEASIGLDEPLKSDIDCREPIPLTLSDGRVIRVGGRVDRIDRLALGGSERYAIWDYKSGSSYGFELEKPFNQGRKLQPVLYMGMLRHRVAALGGDPDSVESFGYFFPGPRADGLRIRWTRAELRNGDDVLKNLCDAISSGLFLPTTDANDCTYCDYLSVCGDPVSVTELSKRKASATDNESLAPWRRLRELGGEAS